MADNIMEMAPPNAKRPKLNSPALSSSDGPGKKILQTLWKHLKTSEKSRLIWFTRATDIAGSLAA